MKRNHGLDLLKAICSFMVICIHTPFPGLAGNITIPLTRIAVPLFFMITGYYYSHTKERNNETRQLSKLFHLFVYSNLLYFGWFVFKCLVTGDSVTAFLADAFSLKSILRFVLLNQSPFSEHLWYLGAILYVALIVFLFEKKWSRQKLYPAIPILLLADLIFGKYALLLLGREIPYIFVRNFLFVGLPYFLIGDILYSRNISVNSQKAALFVVFFAATTLLERFVLGILDANAERDHYISTTFLAVFVFLSAVQRSGAHTGKCCSLLCYIGANLSTGIYILHPAIITVLVKIIAYLSRYVSLQGIYGYTAPFIVFISAVIAAQILHAAEKKLCKKAAHTAA